MRPPIPRRTRVLVPGGPALPDRVGEISVTHLPSRRQFRAGSSMSAIAASTQLNLPLHPDEPTLSSDLSTGGPIVAETKLKKNVLTYTQRKAIDAKLAEVLLPAGDAGQVMWAEGWSDAKVAESMPFACTHHNVHGVRTEVYGPLVDAPEPSPLVDRVVRLERIVKFLAESLGQDMSELEAKCA